MNMKRLLIVVDYQNDFVCGSLGLDNAKKLEKGILEKIALILTTILPQQRVKVCLFPIALKEPSVTSFTAD